MRVLCFSFVYYAMGENVDSHGTLHLFLRTINIPNFVTLVIQNFIHGFNCCLNLTFFSLKLIPSTGWLLYAIFESLTSTSEFKSSLLLISKWCSFWLELGSGGFPLFWNRVFSSVHTFLGLSLCAAVFLKTISSFYPLEGILTTDMSPTSDCCTALITNNWKTVD